MRMDLEVVDALKAAGVPDDKARAVVDSLHREIDQRYALHAAQLATRGDLVEAVGSVKLEMTRLNADSVAAIAKLETRVIETIAGTRVDLVQSIAATKVELVKWFLGSFIAMGGVVTAVFRLMGH
jgi:hypothetical protein